LSKFYGYKNRNIGCNVVEKDGLFAELSKLTAEGRSVREGTLQK